MNESLQVLAGSALGGLARYWMALGAAVLLGPRLPWGTLAINVLDSVALCLLATWAGIVLGRM